VILSFAILFIYYRDLTLPINLKSLTSLLQKLEHMIFSIVKPFFYSQIFFSIVKLFFSIVKLFFL